MNITINPGAATDDAAQIDSIVSQMEGVCAPARTKKLYWTLDMPAFPALQ